MTETHTFLPCPFCGGEAETDLMQPFRHYRTGEPLSQPAVYCTVCSAQIAHYPGDVDLSRDETMDLALTAWNTRADSHHRLVEALEAFAFVGEDNPEDTQAVWEMIYRDRVQDWFSYEDFERARNLLAALKEAGRG